MDNLNTYIDHTLLKANASKEQILKLCQEAIAHEFKAVCVLPIHVSTAKEALKDSDVLVCTVIGFPLGANTPAVKAFEAKCAVEDGADEIDMVINIAALKARDFTFVENDIAGVVAHSLHRTVKVILETCYLDEKEIIYGCEVSAKGGAHFVKTSTGFGSAGATIEDVKLMKKSVPPELFVKASGGIKTKEDAIKMIEAGADRIGTSSGIDIAKKEYNEDSNDQSNKEEVVDTKEEEIQIILKDDDY